MANNKTDSEKREAALRAALSRIDKNLGVGTATVLGEKPVEPIEVIPTGSLAIDIALGRGGVPRGRIIEIYGAESSGKTLFCLQTMKEAQKLGDRVAFIDAEHAFDAEWAGKIGVKTDELVFAQPDSGEDAFEVLETLVDSGAVDVIIVDSVSALTPRKELEGDFGDATMGVQARMMSQGMRKVVGSIKKNNVTVIFINQVRQKIGVVYGNPETTTGGKALQFYASLRLKIQVIGPLKDGTDEIGKRVKITVVKNKTAPPAKVAEFDQYYIPGQEGYSKEADIRDMGEKLGFIKKGGAWFSLAYGDKTQIGQGAENARKYLVDHPEVADEIEQKIRDVLMNTNKDEEPALTEDEEAEQALKSVF